ncbi:exonuclease SbcC [Paenibacillus sp. DS2363]|uniref:AAA family ATPase n=1 Tax=unclassified Paenibacillus TaxID=185978 RepID=UPI0030F69A00
MVYLSKVKIKNFRGYGENEGSSDRCFVYDELDSPLVIFHGYNGFGKTSFFEAVEWCLTDNVYRLEKFYQEKTYQANELKRSHYLKFYHPKHGNIERREIFVELLFTNGLRIVRKSTNNVLRTTERDTSYLSRVYMGTSDLVEVTNELVLHQFILETKDKEAFFHTHMLGQESISDFLRNNSPAKRRDIFMHLLQEEELNNAYQSLSKYQAKNNSLTIKYTELSKIIQNLQNFQIGITDFMKKLNFEDMAHYIRAINEDYNKIKLILSGSDINDLEYDFSLLMMESNIGLNNCIKYLQTVSVEHQRVSLFRNDMNSKYEELLRLSKRFEKASLLEEAKKHLQRSEAANRIKRENSNLLMKESDEINRQIITAETGVKSIQNKKESLADYKNVFTLLRRFISNFDVNIQFWKEWSEEEEKWNKFILDFSSELNINSKTLEIEDINKEWFREVEERSTNLQRTKKQLKENLEAIISQKDSVSQLNKQYQEALNHVKKMVNENFLSIDKCPVCLNDDFSNSKYTSLEGWEDSSTTAEKLVLIIDSTFSAGNEQIALINSREKKVNDNIRALDNQFFKEVTEPLRLRLENILTKFKQQYDDVEKQLNKDLNTYSELKSSLILKNNDIKIQIDRIQESLISLFGSEVKLEELEASSLDDIISRSEEWFALNQSLLGFSSNLTFSEIESELTMLREQYLNGKDYAIVKRNMESIKSKFVVIDDLIDSMKEILNKKLPDEYEAVMIRYEKLEEVIKQYNDEKQQIDYYRTEVSKWHGKLLGKQRQIVKERLENHPIISWVYETINPHPFHKRLHITNTERGTNFIGETQLEDKVDLYLDQIFSAAQLNILALSIFLGLGLTQRYSQLQQLFMDDPIQSMDDVNILAFIDVLRAIMDSRYSNKHIVVSTHDENFAQLLSIKMRNRKMVQYRIVGYTEEGPQIEKIK